MLSWKDVMMKQEQYKDMLRDAENRVLVQEALMEPKRHAPVIWAMLAALVRNLINLGCFLLGYFASMLSQTPCKDAGRVEPRGNDMPWL